MQGSKNPAQHPLQDHHDAQPQEQLCSWRELGRRSWLSPSGVFCPVTPVWQGLNLFHWQTPSQPTFFTSQEAFKITQFMFMNSVKQSPVQQTGSLQASPHQFCSWLSERCDCQQQDPHSASVALEKNLFFFSSSEQRHQALSQEN